MRQSFILVPALAIVLVASLGCAHVGDPCDNDLVNQEKSPDGKVVISVYRRQCAARTYTYAAIEKPRAFLRTRGEVVCHLVNWGGEHPMDVMWKDSTHLYVSTSDELSDLDRGGAPKEACGDIAIKYSIPGYPARAVAEPSLEAVQDTIRFVLEDVRPCIEAYGRRGNPSLDIVADINRYAATGLESQAVGTIIRFSNAAGCEMSNETYARLDRLSKLYKQPPPRQSAPIPPDEFTIISPATR